jgi:hypothetical protein
MPGPQTAVSWRMAVPPALSARLDEPAGGP